MNHVNFFSIFKHIFYSSFLANRQKYTNIGNLGFKSLAFILFEILLLLNSCQNSKLSKSCNFKGKIIQGKPKICVSFFHEESLQEFSR